MKKTLIASVAMAALSGSAFAQALPTLTTSPTSQQTPVTTSVDKACTISSFTPVITVIVPSSGVFAAGSSNNSASVSVTCNTPAAVITVGSNDMKNPSPIDPSEQTTFTDTIGFRGLFTSDNGYTLGTRQGPNSYNATVGNGSDRRIRAFTVTAVEVNSGSLIPVAGNYTGQVCITVDPAGLDFSGAQIGTSTCVGSVATPQGGPV